MAIQLIGRRLASRHSVMSSEAKLESGVHYLGSNYIADLSDALASVLQHGKEPQSGRIFKKLSSIK